MIKNYYPRVKSVFGLCALALSCSFIFSSKPAIAQPTISSVTPNLGISGSATVTITGTNFNALPALNAVYFGGVKAIPTAGSTTTLSVTVPLGALHDRINVLNTATYRSAFQQYPFLPQYFSSCFVPGAYNLKNNVDLPLIAASGAYMTALADLDGDGKLDMIVANTNLSTTGANNISVYRNISTAGSISATSFGAAQNIATVGGVSNIKTADMDGDGKLDVILAYNYGAGGVGLLRNTSTSGTISFAAAPANGRTLPAGSKVSEIAIADFDGDGKLDIAATCYNNLTAGNDHIKIFKNTIVAPPTPVATAGFANTYDTASFALPFGADPVSICAADFDGDGKADLAVANRAFSGSINGSVSIFRNSSSGAGNFNFAPHFEIDLAAGLYGQQVIAADLDGDNKQDIIVTGTDYFTSGTVSVLRNQALSGSLTTSSFVARNDISSTAGAGYVGVAAGDIDADGKVDIAVTDLNAGNVLLYRNTSVPGTVALSVLTTRATGVSPIGVAIADVDGDSKSDVVVTNRGTGTGYTDSKVTIMRNYPLPVISPITGPATVCVPNVDTFRDATAGGEWIVANTALATVNATNGAVTPLAAGTDTVYYRIICNNDTSIVQRTFTVGTFPVVAAITGTTTTMCRSTTQALSGPTGGTWSSSNTAVVSVSPAGVVTARGVGTGTISYTVTNGCGATVQTYGPITVNTAPSPITGTLSVCVGGTTALVDTPSGGTWSSVTMSVATVTSAGVVHGASPGTSVISYTIGSCPATATVTVTSGPVVGPITGATPYVCQGASLSLSNTTTGGTWTITPAGFATINSTTGVVNGVALGAATVSYTVINSCGTTAVGYPLTVNPSAGVITGTTFRVCQGSQITLNNTTGGGTWASTPTSTAVISAGGVVTGVTGGGTATISYTVAGGCFDTATVRVDNLPAPIGGSAQVCVGSSTILTDASTPGSWSTASGIVTIGTTSGNVTGVANGTTTISFTETATGCSTTLPFTVNALPSAITGSLVACVGVTNTLSSSPAGGTWSVSPTSIANIDPVSGAVTGIATGNAIVSYTAAGTGCAVGATITVSPSPGSISGPTSVCLGSFISLTDPTPGGTWFSSNAVVAPVNAIGIVSGATLGTTTISYTVAGCRATHSVTVTPPPAAITGATPLCPFTNITLANTTVGGSWSSGSSSVAVVNASTGVVTGVSGGTAFISYTLATTGCSTFVPVTVHPAPTVTGSPSVCQGYTTLLASDSVGGVWSSSDTMLVKVDTATGLATGRTPGTAVITYTTAAFGCFDTIAVTSYPVIVPLVAIVTSPSTTVCQGTPVTYTANPINGGLAPVYEWRINGTVVSSGASFTYVPNNNDRITLRLTSNATCAIPNTDNDTVSMTVITRRTPILNLSTGGLGDTVCLGVPVTLNPNTLYGGTAPVYSWKINGINVGPGSTFTYVPANGDLIIVKVRSNYVCPLVDTAMDTLRLTVSPYVTPNVTITGSDTACGGYPIIYTANQVNGGTNPTYQWRKNGVNFGTGNTLYYPSPVTGDVIDVILTSNFPCTTRTTDTSAQHVITVVPVDVPSITVSVSPGYILAPGMTATFTAVPVNPGSAPTYRWKKNGFLIPGATTLVYSTNVLATGDSFTCIMTNNDFCNHVSAYASIEVSIGGNVGVNSVNGPNSEINVMPNPTKGILTLRGNVGITTNEDVHVEITNMLGQVVYKSTFNANSGGIDNTITLDDNLTNGMYIMNIHSEHLSKTIHFELAR